MKAHRQHCKRWKTQLYPFNDNRKAKHLWKTSSALTMDNNTIAGATFGRCFLFSSGSLQSYFGMNGQDAVVLLPSKALK